MIESARRASVALACLLSLLFFGAASTGGSAVAAQDSGESRYASIVLDANSGEILFERRADSQRFPASITKVMTLYLVFEAMAEGRISADDWVTISPRAASQPPSKLGLPAGARIRVDDAIRALAVRSANDIAVALAEHVGGSEARFAAMMTVKAEELGMTQTRYANANGLPDSRQITSARDISVLARAVMRDFPQYYSYFGQRTWVFEGRSYNNTNGLLHSMPGVDGIKTGYINASGYNLAASAVRDGRRLITVVLGGRSTASRNAHVADLLNIGFEVERQRANGTDLRTAQMLFASLPGGVGDAYARGGQGPTTLQLASAEVPVSSTVLAASAARDAVAEVLAEPTAPPLYQASQGDARDPAANWIVQVGAFREQDIAQQWLSETTRRFRDQFRNAEGVVAASDNGWFRARYVGFSRAAADGACEVLATRNVPCLVIQGQ